MQLLLKFSSLLILLFFFNSCKQETRVEQEFMACTYAAFDDNGKELKSFMKEYEQMLFEADILKGTTGKDYMQLLDHLSTGNLENIVATDSFLAKVQEMKKPDSDILTACQATIFQDTLRYNTSKILLLETTLNGLNQTGDFEPTLIAKNTAEILTVDDLELDFYKMRVYLLMDMMLINAGVYPTIDRVEATLEREFDLDNALDLKLNAESGLSVDEKPTDIKNLKSLVSAYLRKNESNSVIQLKAENDTAYATYIAVQNEVIAAYDIVREQEAQIRFNSSWESLNKEQKDEIILKFPKNIIDN